VTFVIIDTWIFLFMIIEDRRNKIEHLFKQIKDKTQLNLRIYVEQLLNVQL